MKSTEIICAGCGKRIPVTTGEGHTGIVKCECGAETTVQGEPGAVLDRLNDLLGKVAPLIKEFTQAKRKGFQTGIDEGIHEVAREVAKELLANDPEFKEAMKAQIRQSLEAGLFGPEEGDEDPEPPPRG